MNCDSRRSTSEANRSRIWTGWEEGLSMGEISHNAGVRIAQVRTLIGHCGGIRPASRCRSDRVLSAVEREEISRGLMAGCSMREIARHLGRAPSSVSREVARHGGLSRYRALNADERAWKRARRPKRCLLASNVPLQQLVTQKLLIDWSPQQISGWLKMAYRDDEAMQVSHETIYRSLFVQARGALKKELTAHLRRQRSLRRARKTARMSRRGPIPDAVQISERPAQVEDRAVPGHWEGDLLCGNSTSQIATLVERKSRFVMLVKVPRKDTAVVVGALSKHVRKLPSHLRRSLTWDRGSEFAAHKQFSLATQMQVYFCDPHSPWQRGSNENTNGLLRQYFPKGQDLSSYSQQQLDNVAMRLNQRPRKTLAFCTPAQKLAERVASTD
ncbi:MAG: IS30 family transposase [Steroidobacteraceae bacterium]